MRRIDLHGVKHEDVRTKIIHFIEDNWSADVQVEIITGCSDRMVELVVEIIEEYSLTYNIGGQLDLTRDKVIVFMGWIMKLEGRTIVYENLIDVATGKPVTIELRPGEDVQEVRKKLDEIFKGASEAGEEFKNRFAK